jgi:hypothetical protein
LANAAIDGLAVSARPSFVPAKRSEQLIDKALQDEADTFIAFKQEEADSDAWSQEIDEFFAAIL